MAAALHTINTPLAQTDVDHHQTSHLKNLQGNILKSHGRKHTANVFLKFKVGHEAAAREWVHTNLRPRVTTAHAQLKAAEAFNGGGVDGGVFHAFLLSAAGYSYFGKNTTNFTDPSFKLGSQVSATSLNDPVVGTWDVGFQGTIHAMVLMADPHAAKMRFMARELAIEVAPFADVLQIEFGDQQVNERGDGIEHFGYVDGRSQPLMLDSDLSGQTDGVSLWDPRTGPAQVLVADPFGGPNASGSYFVFRKLEERVKDFKTQEQVLASALGLTGAARELAGALVIGRFEDGTPVTLSDKALIESSTDPNDQSVPNNFDFRADLDGSKCPFHSHIRKSNPRGASPGGLAAEEPRQMARRGITYGDRAKDTFDDISKMPEGGVGLLFMSYQRSIVDQFEFIQKRWVNDPSFPQNATGLDPVIGQHGAMAPAAQQWPKVWGGSSVKVAFDFRDFVVMKGGEYFFAPSLSGIGNL